jgi:hypothetical protein
MILKMFSPKKFGIFSQNSVINYMRKIDQNIGFQEKRNLFTENW